MSDVLTKICDEKLSHVAKMRTARPIGDVERVAKAASAPRHFAKCLSVAVDEKRYGLIGEIKKASPSKGLIRANFDPSALAQAYATGGATCLSVLTDEPYFQGTDAFFLAARAAVKLPVLRKDFMLQPYQIVESRALGADCILLIMAALEDGQAAELASTAAEWGMDILAEVHDVKELERALKLETDLIGVNNRNLKTLEVDIAMTESLAPSVPPDRILISESGLYSPGDLARMAEVGVRCFLVGESLMRHDDVEAATKALLTLGGGAR